jgi:peroxiredoxin
MALTPSTMLALGSKAPNFKLLDTTSGHTFTLQQLKSPKATVIMFICNHCPYVKHIQQQLIQLAIDYQTKGIVFIAISANDAESYPEDGPQEMAKNAKRLGYPFPYLYDETQTTAKAYQAACTPDFYVFDKDLLCVYRGQLDDSRPGNDIAVTGNDLRAALNNILSGEPVNPAQKPSMGCNIKWKA